MNKNIETEPLINNFIKREIDYDSNEILNACTLNLEDVVNFGCKILSWDISRNDRSDEDIPTILFLRNFIEQIDAISILIKSSSIDPCKSILRTAIENLFSLEYLLLDEGKKRSLSFIVWNTISNNKLLKKATGNSKEYKEVLSKYKKDKFLRNSNPLIIKDAEIYLNIGDELLLSDKYNDVYQEYLRTKAKYPNPNWYSLYDGPKNLEDLANNIQLNAIYEIVYRGLSFAVHGNDIIQGKLSKNDKGMAEISTLRVPKDVNAITQNSINIAISVFKSYITKRLPEKSEEFNKWYSSIREFNLGLGNK